jgi:hypothetical protein
VAWLSASLALRNVTVKRLKHGVMRKSWLRQRGHSSVHASAALGSSLSA